MKRNESKQHHYVPKVYLKGFTNESGNFFQYDLKHKKISVRKSSQVGYEIDYFKIQRLETKTINQIDDEYIIEKKAFVEQENFYQKLVCEVVGTTHNLFTFSIESCVLLLKTLITIKRRNPSVKEKMTGAMKNHVESGEFENQVAPYMDLARQIDKKDPAPYIEKIKNQFLNEPSKASDLFTLGFLEPDSKIVKEVTATFLQSRIQIWHSPHDVEFITSDNPGFMLSGTEVLNFGGLSGPYLFAFPLTPQAGLIIDSDEAANPASEIVKIYPKEITKEQVIAINRATAKVAMGKLFARNRDPLQHF